MKFYVSTAFLDTREAVEIAKAADEPLSPQGDIDGDGDSNGTEFEAAIDGGGDLFDFLNTVLNANITLPDTVPPLTA